MKKRDRILGTFGLLIFLWGCSDAGSGDGTLKVTLTDSPACGFDQVNVTLSKVRIHPNEGADQQAAGWREIDLSATGRINLTSLTNGALQEVGTASLPAGRYSQIRLLLASDSSGAASGHSVVPSGNGGEFPLEIPEGAAGGLKLIHPFDVGRAKQVDLALDFDVCRSVFQKGDGGYLLKPVISVIPLKESGQITGVVSPSLLDGHFISNPVVTAQRDGKVVKSTVPDAGGRFILGPLLESGAAGSYDVVFTADEAAPVMIQGVPVKAEATAAVSDAESPMTLQGASSRTVSGTVIPAGSVVRATQSFSTSLAVAVLEVRSALSVLSDGGYRLVLPIAPPSLGLFGAGDLPIPLIPDTAVAGHYRLEASAEGFAPEERPVEITDDLEENFQLSPS